MNCDNCGAGLPANSPVCAHCGTVHALDLHVFASHLIYEDPSRRPCPNGCGPLHDVKVSTEDTLFVQHCPSCKGMQVDRRTLARELGRIRASTDASNPQRLRELAAQRLIRQQPVKRRCPCCLNYFESRLFHSELALRIDQCAEHGTWFDNGEFALLAEWSEAGGAQHISRQADALLPSPERPTQPPPPTANSESQGRPSEHSDEIPIAPLQYIADVMSKAPLGNFSKTIELDRLDRHEHD